MSDIENLGDSENYFLKPVNENNIIEKIQSANSQLFNLSTKNNNSFQMASESNKQTKLNTNTNMNEDLLESKHRVTFSSDIEEYEDNFSDSTDEIPYNDEEAINKELNEIIDRNENGSEINTKLNEFLRISIEELNDNNNNSSNSSTNSTDNNEYTSAEIRVTEKIDDTVSMNSVKVEDSSKNQFQIHSNTKISREKGSTNGMEMKRPKINLSLKFANDDDVDERNPLNAGIAQKRCRAKSAAHHKRNDRISATKKEENLLKIHLNVKACCEFKYLDNARLPKYNGFISQYGLSKDQLEYREQCRRKCIEDRLKRQHEIIKTKQQMANLNELAFRQWLIRKNHEAKPKFKNFYDCTE